MKSHKFTCKTRSAHVTVGLLLLMTVMLPNMVPSPPPCLNLDRGHNGVDNGMMNKIV